MKNKEITKKNSNIKFSLKKWKTRKLVQNLFSEKINWLLFYTHESNVLHNLEFGINIVNDIKLKSGNNYVVWAYSQLTDRIILELSDSSRNNFWEWINKQKIDFNNIAIIAIDLEKLFENSKKNWIYDNDSRTISVFEKISPKTFKWIMIKNKLIYDRIKRYSSLTSLDLKIYYGIDGGIK